MKSKFLRRVLVGLLCAACIITMTGCTTTPDNPNPSDSSSITDAPSEDEEVTLTGARNIAIHDPSIFHDPVSGKYYSYGSHMVAGTSEDMTTQTYICGSSAGTAATNRLFEKDFRDEFAEVFAWLDITKDRDDFGIWALDVTYSQAAADTSQ